MLNQQDNQDVEILCSLCFCPFEPNDHKYTCADPKCSVFTCLECLESLIMFSGQSNLLPKCPSNDCNGIYIISGMKHVPINVIKQYEQECFNYFMKQDGDNVKKRIEERKMIDNIRNERFKFLEQKFPPSIALVAKLTFKDKLRQLDKQKQAIVNLKLKNASKSCMLSVCNGFLDPDFVCMTCSTEFCKKCEKKISNNHQCKQEDLDSVNLVNNMVKCPECQLPVFKNEGCDSITCSNCNTQFLYSTGKRGGHGSLNAKIKVDINKKTNISTAFAEIIPPDCLPLILQFEGLSPPFKSKDILLGPINTYIKAENNKKSKINKNICAKELAKKIDVYTRYKYTNLIYQKYLIEISDLVEKKDSKLKDRLVEIIDEIKI